MGVGLDAWPPRPGPRRSLDSTLSAFLSDAPRQAQATLRKRLACLSPTFKAPSQVISFQWCSSRLTMIKTTNSTVRQFIMLEERAPRCQGRLSPTLSVACAQPASTDRAWSGSGVEFDETHPRCSFFQLLARPLVRPRSPGHALRTRRQQASLALKSRRHRAARSS